MAETRLFRRNGEIAAPGTGLSPPERRGPRGAGWSRRHCDQCCGLISIGGQYLSDQSSSTYIILTRIPSVWRVEPSWRARTAAARYRTVPRGKKTLHMLRPPRAWMRGRTKTPQPKWLLTRSYKWGVGVFLVGYAILGFTKIPPIRAAAERPSSKRLRRFSAV